MAVFQRKRPPLRESPLRVPGQLLEEHFDWLAIMKAGFWIMLPIVFWLLALIDWWQWYWQTPPHPLFNTVVAGAFTA